MKVLGIIVIVVGITLLLVGRSVAGSLPPDYQPEEEDGFLQLLQKTGKVLGGIGVVFIVIGVCCIIIEGILI